MMREPAPEKPGTCAGGLASYVSKALVDFDLPAELR